MLYAKESDIHRSKNGDIFYMAGNYPWPSEATKELLSIANEEFNNQSKTCRLISSNHPYSEGYWLEFPPYKDITPGLDTILKQK